MCRSLTSCREDVGVGLARVEDDRPGMLRATHLQHLQLAAWPRFAGSSAAKPEDEAVRLLGVRVDRAGRAAAVLDDVDVARAVVLDALEAALAEDAAELRRPWTGSRASPRGHRRCAPPSAVNSRRCANGSQVEPSISGQRTAVGLLLGEQGDAVGRIGVEVDARDVAPVAVLVALVQEVRSVVVGGVGPVLTRDHEVGVLVGLGLRRLDVVAGRLDVARRRQQRAVVEVAVEAVAPTGSRAPSSPGRPSSHATAARACPAA